MRKTAILALLFCFTMSMAAQTEPDNNNKQNNHPDTCVHLSEIVVTGLTGNTQLRNSPIPVNVISTEALQTLSYTNIIDAIAKYPGIAQITTGGGISKPVIRGMGYNRVLVVNDGVRQEGQQWGDEHGVEIDGESVHAVEVIKGPASLMYGSDAMAGVIIMHDAPVPPPGKMKVDLLGGYQSNANLWNYSLDFAGNKNGFIWDARWSQKHAGEYANKVNGHVFNSQFGEQAFKGMVGLQKRWGQSRLKFSYYHLKPGIIEGDGAGETGEEPEAPFQQIHHYKVVSDNMFNLNQGYLKLLLGYQQNRRQEFEEPEECGLDFLLHTASYDVRYITPDWRGWVSNFGLNGMGQVSANKGTEFLIPAYGLFDAGLFATTTKSFFRKLHLSGGLRFDIRALHSHALEEDGVARFTDFSRLFPGVSGSVGLSYEILPNLDVRVNAARGFRAPNISELGSNGEHEGTLRYELGNHDLKSEGSWQFDLGMDFVSKVVSARVSLFASWINHYIFLERTEAVVEDKPVFQYIQGNARLLGGEASLVLHIIRHLHFENSFSYVNAQQLHRPADSKYLPFTPAPRWLSTLHYDMPWKSKVVRNMFVEAQVDCYLSQNNVRLLNDTETPTPSYTLLNASFGTDFYAKGRRVLSLHFTAHNILNRAYQSHLNRLKEAGIYDMGRNFGVKVLVPIVGGIIK